MKILLLHGWGLSGKNYQGLIRELEKRRHQVYAPDLPGFGKSNLPRRPLGLTDYVNFVLRETEKRGWSCFAVIGHSFGGRVGIKLAAEYPERVERLILTGVPGMRGNSFKIFLFKILAKSGRMILAIFKLRKLNYYLRKILYRLAGTSDYLRTEGVMRETFKNIINEDLTAAIERINCPTWLVWGREDKITPLAIARKMLKKIKGAKLIVISRGDHKLPYKKAVVFAKAIGLI